MAALAVGAFFISGAAAIVPGSPSNFESKDANVPNSNPPIADGNMTNDAAGDSDWNCFANGNSTGFVASGIQVGSACSGNLVPSGALALADPAATTADDSWVNGQKMDGSACEQVTTNKNPAKDDFTAVASYTEQLASNKHQYLYGATVRVAPNGNASENVELNQKAGTAACPILRTAGDHLLAFDYLNGGGKLNLHELTWIDSSNPTAGGNDGSGACIIKTDSMPCWGATVITPSDTSFEGDVSQSQIDANKNGINGQLLSAGEFAEFGVDLTAALNQDPNACNTTSQITWESRSSGSSFSSNPEDISIEKKTVSNCGSITIVKNTDPRNIDQNFGYTASGGSISPTSFKLNDKNALPISSITATNPAVVVTAANGFTAGDRVGLTITGSNSTPSANGNWKGTVIDPTHISIPLAVTTAGTAGSVTFNTQVYGDLLGGTTYTFNEPSVNGFSLESLTCKKNGTTDATVVSGSTATIPLKANDNWVCTYVNQALAEVKIIKRTDPRGIDQAFSFTSDLPTTGTTSCTQSTAASFSLNDKTNSGNNDSAGNTQDCTNVPVGTYHVTEGTDPAGFSLESLSCTASTGSSGTQDGTTPKKANITIVAGGLVTCTYINRATAEIRIIKHTDPRGINAAFSFTSDLPTSGPTSCTHSTGGETAASFSLNDGGNTNSDNGANTQDCTTVPVGTYHVTEGTDPTGFSLESLTCNASTGSSGAQDGTTPKKANITIVAGGLVTCTYVNRATAEVKIIKHTDPRGINQGFSFTSNLAGGTLSCTQPTAASFSLNDTGNSGGGDSLGNTQDCTGVAPGSYAVTEGAEPNGWTLEDLSCTASTGSSGAKDGSNPAKANITLVAGGSVTCTYTNKQPTGAILITKTGKYKNCAKAGDPVKNANNTQVGVCTAAATAALGGATFTVSGADLLGNPISIPGNTTSNTTGTVCVDGLPWTGLLTTYNVTETSPPNGYSKDPSNTDPLSVLVVQNASCSDANIATEAGLAPFNDIPLTDLSAHVAAELPGATNSSISCVNSSSNPIGNSPQPASGMGDPETVTANGLKPGTYTCTVVIDP